MNKKERYQELNFSLKEKRSTLNDIYSQLKVDTFVLNPKVTELVNQMKMVEEDIIKIENEIDCIVKETDEFKEDKTNE